TDAGFAHNSRYLDAEAGRHLRLRADPATTGIREHADRDAHARRFEPGTRHGGPCRRDDAHDQAVRAHPDVGAFGVSANRSGPPRGDRTRRRECGPRRRSHPDYAVTLLCLIRRSRMTGDRRTMMKRARPGQRPPRPRSARANVDPRSVIISEAREPALVSLSAVFSQSHPR